jgi:hypothetical protein
MGAHDGHIIVKGNNDTPPSTKGRYGTGQFFKEVDSGSAKPAFCYPKRADNLRNDLRQMKKTLEMGHILPERKMAYEQNVKKLEKRVSEINESFSNAKKIIETGKDGWATRRQNLGKEISEMMPTRKDVRDRRVNPHSVLRREKQGDKGSRPLQDLKRDYTIISRAMQASGDYEESDHSFLQKDR